MKTKKNKKQFTCSICNNTFEGWGNNAQPVNDGVCCDRCNMIVISERICYGLNFSKPSNTKKNV